jgi:hypothetical protein
MSAARSFISYLLVVSQWLDGLIGKSRRGVSAESFSVCSSTPVHNLAAALHRSGALHSQVIMAALRCGAARTATKRVERRCTALALISHNRLPAASRRHPHRSARRAHSMLLCNLGICLAVKSAANDALRKLKPVCSLDPSPRAPCRRDTQ